MTTQTVTFGAGCFWGVEYVFRRVPGVTGVQVGYAGGITPNPTYREVCSHTTGHAEVLQVQFDDEQVSFDQLLEVFWAMHDPTQVNRQGPDVGDQYRSVDLHDDRRAVGGGEGLEGARAGAVRPTDRDRDPRRRRSSTRPRTTTRPTTRRTATRRTATWSRSRSSRSRGCSPLAAERRTHEGRVIECHSR